MSQKQNSWMVYSIRFLAFVHQVEQYTCLLLSDQNGMLFTLLTMERINRGGTVGRKTYECSVGGGSHHKAINTDPY
ncbi:MAG: hypothetical protein RRZ64_00180 [Rikenellaceae bacterium]